MPMLMPRMFCLGAACLAIVAGTALAVQPEPPTAPGTATKAPPSIPDALDLLHRAYRSGPVADRVVIKATDAAGKDRRVQVVVYTDVGESPKEIAKEPVTEPAPTPTPTPTPTTDKPTEPTPKLRPPQFRIDLSQLHVHVQDSTLTAINLFDRTTYFRTPCDASPLKALASNFPAVPVPQVALAYAEGTLLAEPTPLTAGATWTSIETGVEVGRAMLILKGSSSTPHATLTLAFDRQTNRLRRFVAEYPGATGAALAKLELTSSPADSGTPKNWLLPVEGRTKVDSPALLVPPRGGLSEGSSIKHASLMTPSLAPVTPESLFDKGPAATPPRAIALVTYRGETLGDGEASEDIAAAISSAVAACTSPDFRVGVIGLLDKGSLDPVKIDALSQRLTSLATGSGVQSQFASMLTASEVLNVERGGQPVQASIIVIAPDLKVLGVVVADGRSDQAGKLREEIAAILATGTSPPPAKDKPGEPKGSPGLK